MQNHIHRERDALEYQERMLDDLRRMASEGRQEMLQYLLEMAYLEVRELLGKPVRADGRRRAAEAATTS